MVMVMVVVVVAGAVAAAAVTVVMVVLVVSAMQEVFGHVVAHNVSIVQLIVKTNSKENVNHRHCWFFVRNFHINKDPVIRKTYSFILYWTIATFANPTMDRQPKMSVLNSQHPVSTIA